MSRRTHVTVVCGGESSEHDVSLASASAVEHGLLDAGFTVRKLVIGQEGIWRDSKSALGSTPLTSMAMALTLLRSTDVVFPVLHGLGGEDGTMAALCQLAHVPFVGSRNRAGAIAIDKWVTKLIAQELGIATARGTLLEGSTPYTWTEPVVVKPVTAGSSYGVTLVEHPAELDDAIVAARQYDDRVLVEELIQGREIDVAIMRTADGQIAVGAPLEIITHGIFDTNEKYGGTAQFSVPASIRQETEDALNTAARKVFAAMECDGVVRIDFFVAGDGTRVILNEINTLPGMTERSQVPRIFAARGWSYPKLLAELVEGALNRHPKGSAWR